MMAQFPCPCCDSLTLAEQSRGSYDICPVCFWEDDGVQFDDPNYRGGANSESLNEARLNFVQFGASSKGALKHVRPPTYAELGGRAFLSSQRAENMDSFVAVKAAMIARLMLAGQIDLHEGIHFLSGIGTSQQKYRDTFLSFVGLDSELDAFPVGEARQHWEAQALASKDAERDAYLAKTRASIETACHRLLGDLPKLAGAAR